MQEQLRCLLTVSELAKVTLQVISDEAGAHPGMTGPFTVLAFPEVEDLPAVYVDTAAGHLFVEEPEGVKRFQVAFERLRAIALSPSDSLQMISSMTK